VEKEEKLGMQAWGRLGVVEQGANFSLSLRFLFQTLSVTFGTPTPTNGTFTSSILLLTIKLFNKLLLLPLFTMQPATFSDGLLLRTKWDPPKLFTITSLFPITSNFLLQVPEASLLRLKEFYAGFGSPKVSLPSLRLLPGDSLEEHLPLQTELPDSPLMVTTYATNAI
jgi:hypothetical protein